MLDRDAIVIGDGGDFVSYAGRVVDTYEPGCWMDPGPYGCLGAGPGQAIGAKVAHPDRQVVCLLGDGAFGFSRPRVRHDGPPRPAGRRGHRQQRHLGARVPPDEVPLRLPGRRRAAARRPATTRSSRRSAATASWSASRPSCARRSSAPSRPASRRWSTSSPTLRSSIRARRCWRRSPRAHNPEVGQDPASDRWKSLLTLGVTTATHHRGPRSTAGALTSAPARRRSKHPDAC